MKSNQWVSTFSVTLDTTQLTNPPAVTLLWPTDGASIAADSVTLRGRVADGNILVGAVVTDDSGNTQVVDGLVERDGAFRIDDLPLTGSTNSVTITVTDPGGNVAVTNITILRASVTLTIDEIADSDLLQPMTTVTGTIDSADHAVWVNGQQAINNGNGT